MTVKYGKLYAKDASGNVVQIIPESQTIEEYQGATSNAAGLPGLVPGALSSEKDKYLKGDGSWGLPEQYVHPTTSGYKHIPSGGATNQILKWASDGTAQWSAEYSYTHPTTAGNKHIPSGGSTGQVLKWNADGTAEWGTLDISNMMTTNTDQTVTGVKTFTKNTFSTPIELSGTAIDVSTADVFVKTISANTTFTITGVPSNTVAMFSLVLTNAGAYTLTFPNSVEWNEDIELKTSGTDILTFITPNGGTNWYAYGNAKGVDNYQGATSNVNGVAGLVPAATSAQKDNFLKGDGTWASVNISNMVTTDTNQTITGQKTFNSTVFGKTVALSGTQINVTDGTIFTKTITADTTFTFTGVPANAVAMFSLVLTNGGAYTITWPNNVLFSDGIEPELQTSGTDLLSFITFNGGTTWINGNGTNTPAMSSSDIINTIENLS